jgi:hypothetical protein
VIARAAKERCDAGFGVKQNEAVSIGFGCAITLRERTSLLKGMMLTNSS